MAVSQLNFVSILSCLAPNVKKKKHPNLHCNVLLIVYNKGAMDLIQIQQKLELAEKAASKRYDAAADAKAHYKSLDRQSKNMLASIILEQEGSSKAIKEVKALASSEWEEHCDGLEIAE